MILTRLMLRHFRNYRQAELETDPRTNLFIGENAQGKTNLLEAVHVLALTKSHRTHKDRELVAWEEKEARIYGEVERKYGLCKLDLLFHAQGKRARINGLEQKKLSDFIGTLNVVMFAPEDLEIVKGSPGIRRRFMDMEIGQVQPNYVYLLARYLKVLHQRNQLLKQLQSNGHSDGALLEIWDRQLADYGSKIMKKRQNFITKLLIWAKKIHGGIAGDRETLEIEYQPSFDVEDFADESVLFEQFMIKLSHIRLQELKRGTTLIRAPP